MGQDGHRPGRARGRALRARRPVTQPGPRRPACLRRARPRHRPDGPAQVGTTGAGEDSHAARPAARQGTPGASPRLRGHPEFSDPRRARRARRRVLPRDDRPPGPRLRDDVPRPPVHPGRPALHASGQPATRRPALSGRGPQGCRGRPGRPSRPSDRLARGEVRRPQRGAPGDRDARGRSLSDRDFPAGHPDAHLPDLRPASAPTSSRTDESRASGK